MPKKKGDEREKTASALGQKMDVQTLNQKERIQTFYLSLLCSIVCMSYVGVVL